MKTRTHRTSSIAVATALAIGAIAAGCGEDDVNDAIDEGKQQVEKAGKEIDKAGGNLDEKAGKGLENVKDETGEGLKGAGKELDEKKK